MIAVFRVNGNMQDQTLYTFNVNFLILTLIPNYSLIDQQINNADAGTGKQ
jgi:hypothetical protein